LLSLIHCVRYFTIVRTRQPTVVGLETREIRDRIAMILEKFTSVGELASRIGVSDNAIYKWLSNRGQPGIANLIALAQAAGVSVEWLATGKERRAGEPPSVPDAHSADYVFPPRRRTRGHRGRTGFLCSEQVVDYLALKAQWVRTRLNTDPRNLLLLETEGDSMMPTLGDSDLVLVDIGEPRFKRDGVYVLRHHGDLSVKRLQRRPDGRLTVKCDNPVYESSVVAADLVHIIGRVVWSGRRL